jgi:hypothetical protein
MTATAAIVIHDARFGVRLPHEGAERLRLLAVRNGMSVSAEGDVRLTLTSTKTIPMIEIANELVRLAAEILTFWSFSIRPR